MALRHVVLLVWLLGRAAKGDVTADRSECTEQLVGLAACLPYVQGQAKAPAPDCCGGLKQVLGKSPKCLCVLIKDRNDPNLGININASLALALPAACAAHANVSHCPKLLNLPPNSKDAAIFNQAANGSTTAAPAKDNSATGSAGSSSSAAQQTSHGTSPYARAGSFSGLMVLLTGHAVLQLPQFLPSF